MMLVGTFPEVHWHGETSAKWPCLRFRGLGFRPPLCGSGMEERGSWLETFFSSVLCAKSFVEKEMQKVVRFVRQPTTGGGLCREWSPDGF